MFLILVYGMGFPGLSDIQINYTTQYYGASLHAWDGYIFIFNSNHSPPETS